MTSVFYINNDIVWTKFDRSKIQSAVYKKQVSLKKETCVSKKVSVRKTQTVFYWSLS